MARALLEQSDAALSRVRLAQIASLPDAPQRPDQPQPAQWTVEVPMLLGKEQSVAQFQISRDGRSGAEAQDRAWHMRFAVNFRVLGEVGAHVLLRGKRASVMLWAAEGETAEVLEQMLPELAAGFAATGLEPGSIQCRQGVPRAAGASAGGYLDSVT